MAKRRIVSVLLCTICLAPSWLNESGFVYRFIATGSIEEKIFQRQSHKQSLSSCVVDSAEDVERHFSVDSLRELFQLRLNTTSDTHDTFKCKRCKADGRQTIKAPAMLYGDTSTWNHFVNDGLQQIQDLLLRQECGVEAVSAVFQYISHVSWDGAVDCRCLVLTWAHSNERLHRVASLQLDERETTLARLDHCCWFLLMVDGFAWRPAIGDRCSGHAVLLYLQCLCREGIAIFGSRPAQSGL